MHRIKLLPRKHPYLGFILALVFYFAQIFSAYANPMRIALEREFPRFAELLIQTPSGRVFLEQIAGTPLPQAQLRPFLQTLLREQSASEQILERLRAAQQEARQHVQPMTETSHPAELENFADRFLHDPQFAEQNERLFQRLRSTSAQSYRSSTSAGHQRSGPGLLQVLSDRSGTPQPLSDRITRLSQLAQNRTRFGQQLSQETRLPEVSRWSIQGPPPPLAPTHLLPPAFVQTIEREIGPVEMFVTPGIEDIFGARVQKLALEVRTRDRQTGYCGTLAKVTFFDASHLPAGLQHEGWILADGLSLQNPLRPDGSRADEWRAGVPSVIFEYAQRGFFQILRASSATHTFSFAQNNYALSVLYRRTGGMRPTATSQPYFEMLDRTFDYATRFLPEAERARGLLDFQRFLGGVGKDLSHAEESELAALAWSSYRLNRTPPAGMTLLRNENGQIIGMRLTHASPQSGPQGTTQPVVLRRPIIRFINTVDSTPEHPALLEWGRLAERSLEGITSLVRALH